MHTPLEHTLPWERPALGAGIVYAIGQIVAAAYFITVLAPHLPPLDAPLPLQGAFYSDYARENALVAYILKDAAQDDVLRAIRSVGRGEAIFSPSIATRVLDAFAAPSVAVPRERFPMLTEREREILAALARGSSNAQIAEQFDLTPKTVRNYVSAVLTKLQVVDRAEAILRARDAGLGR